MVQIIRRNPIHPLHQLQSEMDRVFSGLLQRSGEGLPEREPRADVDLRETESELLVRVEIAGIEPDELELSVAGNVLTIAGEKKDDRGPEREGWRVTERRFGALRRQLRLAAKVDAARVSAEVKNGVLTVRLPKTQAEQPRKIPIQTGD